MQSYHQLYETTLRNNIPVLTMSTSANQLFPAALSGVMGMLESNLNIAAAAVASGGDPSQIAAVQAEQDAFAVLQSISVDPTSIPGTLHWNGNSVR